jgi:hypothetical protein
MSVGQAWSRAVADGVEVADAVPTENGKIDGVELDASLVEIELEVTGVGQDSTLQDASPLR